MILRMADSFLKKTCEPEDASAPAAQGRASPTEAS